MRNSETGEDAVFDIINALERNGLPDHDRPEHVDRRFYPAAQKEASTSLLQGRPWVAPVATDLLHHFSPQPSVYFGSDLSNAAKTARRSECETFFQFHRHLQTWANSHVALGATSRPYECWWLAYDMELADALAPEVAHRYTLTRLTPLVSQPQSGKPLSSPSAAGVSLAKGRLCA